MRNSLFLCAVVPLIGCENMQSGFTGTASNEELSKEAYLDYEKEAQYEARLIFDSDDELDTDLDAGDEKPSLMVAPLIFAPTYRSFGVNAVVSAGDPDLLRLHVRPSDGEKWKEVTTRRLPGDDIAEWTVTGLEAGTAYDYIVSFVAPDGDESEQHILFKGEAVTQRKPGESFSFSMITDTHIRPPYEISPGLEPSRTEEETLLATMKDVEENESDFMIHLGDMLDFHAYGFNNPPPDSGPTRIGYLNYRKFLADPIGSLAHFLVIGNWEGENGCYEEDEIERSLSQRLLYAPGPEPETYPEGGSPNQNYYAFTWGDAMFIVLDVMGYTSTWHLLSTYPGDVDDWTLGEEQLEWLEETLENASSKWRFIFIHHTVGGAAGDYDNSAYGRGGGQAAAVGEQALVHELMLEHGVQIFFYGHDHVFTDMVVDDIHYTLPGSAGAIWKFTTAETGYEDYFADSGHGRVTVSPDHVEVEFVAVGGEVLYSYTLE